MPGTDLPVDIDKAAEFVAEPIVRNVGASDPCPYRYYDIHSDFLPLLTQFGLPETRPRLGGSTYCFKCPQDAGQGVAI